MPDEARGIQLQGVQQAVDVLDQFLDPVVAQVARNVGGTVAPLVGRDRAKPRCRERRKLVAP